MPLLRRARAAALCTALLAVGCLVTATAASAAPAASSPASCVQDGPNLRYLVIFDPGTPQSEAENQITADCGTTTIYYAPIAVAVATSPDPTFGDRMGPNRAYSAQGEAYLDSDDNGAPGVSKKSDEIQSGLFPMTSGTESVSSENRTGDQWDMDMIKADQAHKVDQGSSKVLVGVLDSGVDPNQPNLAKEIDPSASAGCLSGAPDTSQSAWAPTTSAHGTHVAGTIAAADDGKGIAGVAPGVRIASVKVVDDSGYIYPEAAVCGFMWAAENGMNIANNSYFIDPWVFTCADTTGQNVVYTAVQRAVTYATDHGVLSIAAAGNAGVDLTDPGVDTRSPDNVDSDDQQRRVLGEDCAQLPAGLPGVVTVSSVGADELKAGYSSYGLGAIDLTAPGGDSHQRAADGDSCVLSTIPDGYATSCGTSMATPHVSGVAALLASTHPDATPHELTELLNEEATPVPCPSDYDLNGTGTQDAYCTGDSNYNSFYGHGLVDALSAVTQNLPAPPSTADSSGTREQNGSSSASNTPASTNPSCTSTSTPPTSTTSTPSTPPVGDATDPSAATTGPTTTDPSAPPSTTTATPPPARSSPSCTTPPPGQSTPSTSTSTGKPVTNSTSAQNTPMTQSSQYSAGDDVPPMLGSLIPDGVW